VPAGKLPCWKLPSAFQVGAFFLFFCTREISSKRKLKNKKPSDFGGFYVVWRKEKARKYRQISIFSFQCVGIRIERLGKDLYFIFG
jgi:hypothetical protein